MLITPEHIRQTYLRSILSIEIAGVWVDARMALEVLPQPIFVITAVNPEHKMLDDVESGIRNVDLRKDLLACGLQVSRATGSSPGFLAD